MTASKIRVTVLMLLVVVAGGITGACNRSTVVEASITVEGMHCESCSSAITEALTKIDGVSTASANHETGSATATYESPGVSTDELSKAIEDLGYTVTGVKTGPAEG
jgi:copper chaperone CopZ